MHVQNKIKIVAIILVLISTFGLVTVNAKESDNKQLILSGQTFGLKLFTNGVIVIEIDENNSPAKQAGIQVNDIIISANNITVESNEQLKEIINNSNGEKISLSIKRNNQTITKNIVPEKVTEQEYVVGMWIRDSTAGIGTVTYFDPSNNSFGALGHGICDKDTGMLMPLRDGEIMSATVSHHTKASKGVVGGLNGFFSNEKIGEITINNGFGIYGEYEYYQSGTIVQAANDNEIEKGDAYILSTIDEKGPKKYSVKISKINLSKTNGQNMIVTVTDKELLQKTGGIIQGMSGSPIVQNGKLVGAVTHVFVNSPEKGYGISISNMLNNYEQFS